MLKAAAAGVLAGVLIGRVLFKRKDILAAPSPSLSVDDENESIIAACLEDSVIKIDKFFATNGSRVCHQNALMCAVRKNNLNAVKTLLHHGVSAALFDEGGWTGLFWAARGVRDIDFSKCGNWPAANTLEMVQVLLAAGCPVNAFNGKVAALDVAVYWHNQFNDNTEIIKTLLAAGATVTPQLRTRLEALGIPGLSALL